MLTWGAALLYHDAVRLGGADLAREPLARIAAATTAPLVAVMAEHARAAASNDASGLAGVAARFARRGSPLLAAEAFAQAAAATRTGQPEHNRLAARAVHLAASCSGAATPLLVGLSPPLSEREWEIARAAWAGESSRAISQRLYLSVRTVDNHLASVYRKLGVPGREDLHAVFGSAGDEG